MSSTVRSLFRQTTTSCWETTAITPRIAGTGVLFRLKVLMDFLSTSIGPPRKTLASAGIGSSKQFTRVSPTEVSLSLCGVRRYQERWNKDEGIVGVSVCGVDFDRDDPCSSIP